MINAELHPATAVAADAEIPASVRWPIAETLLLLLAIILAIVTCFHGLAAKSLWFDEAFSVELTRLDWTSMWHVIARQEANMMLYYVLLHLWLQLGTGEFVARMPSALFAVATLVPLYAVGRHLLGRRQAAVAVMLMVVNSFFVRYAQELRGYSLVLLLTTTASYLFLVAFDKPSPKHWGLYLVVSVLAVYAHFFGALVVAAHALCLVLSRARQISWLNLAVVYGLIGLLISPLIWLSGGSNRLGWVPPTSLGSVYRLFGALTGGGRVLLLAYLAVCVFGAVSTLVGHPVYRRGSWTGLFLLSWLLVPFIATFIVSITLQPILVPRYLIVMLPALVLLAASGIVALPRPSLRIAAFIVLFALSIRGLVRWYTAPSKEDWRSASEYVLSTAGSGDGLVFEAPYVRIPFEYYRRLRQGDSDRSDLVYVPAKPGAFDVLHPQNSVAGNDTIVGRHSPSRLWVVQSHVQPPLSPDSARSWLPPTVRGRYRIVEERAFPGIRVFLHAAHDSLP